MTAVTVTRLAAAHPPRTFHRTLKAHSHRALALPLRCASLLLPVSSTGKSKHTQHFVQMLAKSKPARFFNGNVAFTLTLTRSVNGP